MFSDSQVAECTSSYDGPWTQNLKIRPIFSDKGYVPVAEHLELTFKFQGLMIDGIGESFPNLKTLHIRNTVYEPLLFSFERRHFENMPNLKDLTLNEVEVLAEDAFDSLPNLETFDLYWSHDFNAEKLLKNLVNLKRLLIRKLPIDFVPGNFFLKMKSLEAFYFDKPEFQILERKNLNNLSNIKEIFFDDSVFEEIMEDAFQDCISVKSMFLNIHKVIELKKKTFWNLKNLDILTIYGGSFKSIPVEMLNGVNLTELSIVHSKLDSLDETFFETLESLRTLDFSDNQIVVLPENIFKPLVNVKTINFKNCKIENLPFVLFENNLMIEEIDFSDNRLKSIDVDFTKLSKLRILSLSDNFCITQQFTSDGSIPEIQNIIRSNCTQP